MEGASSVVAKITWLGVRRLALQVHWKISPSSWWACFKTFSQYKKCFLLNFGMYESISSGAQYVNLHSTIGWRKVKIYGFGSRQRYWFSIIAQFEVAKRQQQHCAPAARKECNKYDLTTTQGFWLTHHNDWSRWFAISTPPPVCCPSFSLMGGVS
jgi:hypothetical protein